MTALKAHCAQVVATGQEGTVAIEGKSTESAEAAEPAKYNGKADKAEENNGNQT